MAQTSPRHAHRFSEGHRCRPACCAIAGGLIIDGGSDDSALSHGHESSFQLGSRHRCDSSVVTRLTALEPNVRRSTWTTLSAIAAVWFVFMARPMPVLAECPWFPVPPATDAARSAREVIVGTVLQNYQESMYRFRLRIDHVLRGPAEVGQSRRFEDLYPKWPFTRSADGKLYPPCAPIPAWKGDVIALSLDALAPDGKTRYNAASYIRGYIPPPFRENLDRTTLDEMRAIAAMPATDTEITSVPPTAPSAVTSVLPFVTTMAFAIAAILFGDRARTRIR